MEENMDPANPYFNKEWKTINEIVSNFIVFDGFLAAAEVIFFIFLRKQKITRSSQLTRPIVRLGPRTAQVNLGAFGEMLR